MNRDGIRWKNGFEYSATEVFEYRDRGVLLAKMTGSVFGSVSVLQLRFRFFSLVFALCVVYAIIIIIVKYEHSNFGSIHPFCTVNK